MIVSTKYFILMMLSRILFLYIFSNLFSYIHCKWMNSKLLSTFVAVTEEGLIIYSFSSRRFAQERHGCGASSNYSTPTVGVIQWKKNLLWVTYESGPSWQLPDLCTLHCLSYQLHRMCHILRQSFPFLSKTIHLQWSSICPLHRLCLQLTTSIKSPIPAGSTSGISWQYSW